MTVTVDVVVPVYNEETDLAKGVRTLHQFMSQHLPPGWRITIADNGTTDSTLQV
ncbi:MAG: glycosyltransferase, partial [Chloroflexota bacterium]